MQIELTVDNADHSADERRNLFSALQTDAWTMHGSGRAHGATAAVSQMPITANLDDEDDEMEHKYDEPQTATMDAETIITEPVHPPTPLDELKVIAAMEYRGKSAPTSQQQRNQLIMNEHAHGHFGREAIFRTLYKKGYWWPGIRQHIQEQIRKCIPCLRHVIAKTGFDPVEESAWPMPIHSADPVSSAHKHACNENQVQ